MKPTASPGTGTVLTEAEDERGPLDLGAAENAELCRGCVRCCDYVTIQVDPPRAAWEYDQWIWALHHRGVQLYVERPESWHLFLAAPCRHLASGGSCAIHGRHPVLCREYDARSCERRLPLADVRAWFEDAEQLEDWLRRNRPRHWERLVAYRRRGSEAAAASLPAPALGAEAAAPLGIAVASPTGRRRER